MEHARTFYLQFFTCILDNTCNTTHNQLPSNMNMEASLNKPTLRLGFPKNNPPMSLHQQTYGGFGVAQYKSRNSCC